MRLRQFPIRRRISVSYVTSLVNLLNGTNRLRGKDTIYQRFGHAHRLFNRTLDRETQPHPAFHPVAEPAWPPAAAVPGLSPARMLDMSEVMLLARTIDARQWILNRQGIGAFHISCQGHEGSGVGSAFALDLARDTMVPYYRSLAAVIAFLRSRIDEGEQKVGGIIIPDSAKEKPQQGKVIAAGAGKVKDDGKRIALDVKAGDLILFGKYSGQEIKLDGEEFLIMREDEVLAVIDADGKKSKK